LSGWTFVTAIFFEVKGMYKLIGLPLSNYDIITTSFRTIRTGAHRTWDYAGTGAARQRVYPAGRNIPDHHHAGSGCNFSTRWYDNHSSGGREEDGHVAVELAENPTTGFTWNATLSPGLDLQSTDYHQTAAATGMVGVGGTRSWVIIAKDSGSQKFSASYRRSWENVTGNETSYGVNINVVAVWCKYFKK
jgi:predicted secreted protein